MCAQSVKSERITPQRNADEAIQKHQQTGAGNLSGERGKAVGAE